MVKEEKTPETFVAMQAASINAASGRRGSTMSNFSRRSSDYDIPNDVDEFPETNEDEIKEEEGETGRYNPNDSVIHEAIPSLPLKAAIVCLILNLVIPGSGKCDMCFTMMMIPFQISKNCSVIQ